ncbi:MAG: alginate export family protein [Wenzhouxiangellaceae bacterium]
MLPITSAQAEDGGFLQALKDGDFSLSFRYRLETVDQDNFTEDAEASTLRTRLNYHSGQLGNFSFFVEVDDVSEIGPDDFNSTRNGLTQFPVVADPTGTAVNQAWLDFIPTPNNRFVLGRQRINHGDERFIGGVAWRQNEQTYDAITWTNSDIEGLDFQYGYINRVKRIFGPDDGVPSDDFDSDSHIFHAQYSFDPLATLSAYGYWLDFKNAAAASSKTLGLRLSGKYKMESTELGYAAEWATQDDYGDNPIDYTADFYRFEINARHRWLNAAIGVDVLEGDADRPGSAFSTPLATLHKFQGWADIFLNTPAAGIVDRRASLGADIKGYKLVFIYHDFEAQDGNLNYGDEINLQLTKSFGKYGSLLIKYAQYYADDFAFDSRRFWFQYAFGF